MGGVSLIMFTNERNEQINNIEAASIQTGKGAVVQKFGRFYTLEIVRWLAEIFEILSQKACHKNGIEAFFGMHEFFKGYAAEDRFLLNRKIWPIS